MSIRFQQFVAFMLAVACLTGSFVAVAAQATPVVDRCADAEAYVASFNALTDELEVLNQQTGLDTDKMEEWAPEDFVTYAAAFASIGEEVAKLTPPPAAETANSLMIEFLTLTSDVISLMGTDGFFAFFLSAAQFEQLETDANAAIWAFEEECKIAWVDDDEDGTPEIGPGNPVIEATPVASPDAGQATSGEDVGATRENPVPMGTPVMIDDWEVTVLSVMPDATDFVISDDEFFSVEPEAGRQYFVARISATYSGDTSDTLDAEYRFNVVGESAVAYTWSEDSCGYDVPDAISNSEVFSGGTIEGNLCWSIRSEDADSLVMYDDSAEKTDRIFTALFGERLGLPGMIDAPVATAEPSAPAQAISINEFYFLPGQLTIAANSDQTIEITNDGTMAHTFTIDELNVDLALEPGQRGQVTLNVPAGTYQFYCTLPGHMDAGLYGSLFVE